MKGRRRSFGQRKSMSTGMVMSSDGSLRCLRPVLLEAHQQRKGRSYVAASFTHMAHMAAGWTHMAHMVASCTHMAHKAASCTHMAQMVASCTHMAHMVASCTHMAHMAASCPNMSEMAYMTGKLFFALQVVPAADHTHRHGYRHAPNSWQADTICCALCVLAE